MSLTHAGGKTEAAWIRASDAVNDTAKDVPLLHRLFTLLDEAGAGYVVSHDYEDYAGHDQTATGPRARDVDIVVDPALTPRRLLQLIARERERLRADVVQAITGNGLFLVLHDRVTKTLLSLHVMDACRLGNLHLSGAEELLRTRRRYGAIWVPQVHMEFGYYLCRCLYKRILDRDRLCRLTQLYGQDPAGCKDEIGCHFAPSAAALVREVAVSGEWERLANPALMLHLRRQLVRRLIARHPVQIITQTVRSLARKIGRLWQPMGLYVVLLGPDGSGKSTLVHRLEDALAALFSQCRRRTFPPALLQRGSPPTNTAPHATAPRSPLVSIVRAVGYWWPYCAIGHWFIVRPELARQTLVIFDRHLFDAIVDPVRYRYAGPRGLIRLICRFVPSPDLVVLLDAAPQILHARKQEVPLEETTRQCREYRALLERLPGGQIVDAGQDCKQVTENVRQLILDVLIRRSARRIASEEKS